MPQTPEQRASKYLNAEWGTHTVEEHATLARAIRAGENAALERAAKAFNWREVMQGDHIASRLRSLKSRAPRVAAKWKGTQR